MLLPPEPYAAIEELYPLFTQDAVVHPQMHLVNPVARPKVLLVNDDNSELFLTRRSLETQDCDVVSATTVTEALKQIATQSFDVLITNLHMPEPGDGFALVTAMRHSQPQVLTMVVSDYPDVQKAMNAILLQADEVLVKPFDVKQLARLIGKGTVTMKPAAKSCKESVAAILDRDVDFLIQGWLARVHQAGELSAMVLSAEDRAAHLPEMIRNITTRLCSVRDLEVTETTSAAAAAHGQCRYRQRYTAPMIVQESRLLQVSIFETIQRNLATVDFTKVLTDIMIIADEVDSQLKQTIASFLTLQREEVTLASSVLASEPVACQSN
jgi:ActR/RegA family two-component response regulator